MTMHEIDWLHDWDEAFARARTENKPVLVAVKKKDDCIGCEQLDAYTYPDPGVQAAINDRFVPLRFYHLDEKVRDLHLLWLPTNFIFDKRGVEHYRSINALQPADYLDVLDIGEALTRMRSAEYGKAVDLLESACDSQDRRTVARRGDLLPRHCPLFPGSPRSRYPRPNLGGADRALSGIDLDAARSGRA